MSKEIIKTIPVNGLECNIHSFDPVPGSEILRMFLKAFTKFISENVTDTVSEKPEGMQDLEGFEENLITSLSRQLPENDYANVQKKCLQCVTVVMEVGDTKVNSPIYTAGGSVGFVELNNFMSFSFLTSQVLVANLKPFFSPAGLKELMKGEMVSNR